MGISNFLVDPANAKNLLETLIRLGCNILPTKSILNCVFFRPHMASHQLDSKRIIQVERKHGQGRLARLWSNFLALCNFCPLMLPLKQNNDMAIYILVNIMQKKFVDATV